MKKLAFFLLVCLIAGCKDSYDYNKARDVSAKAVQLMKSGNYQEMAKLYSYDFGNSETPERREEKFKKIFDATGEIKEMKLIDSTGIQITENYEGTFRYKLHCTKVNVIGYFSIIKERGKYFISKINIEQE